MAHSSESHGTWDLNIESEEARRTPPASNVVSGAVREALDKKDLTDLLCEAIDDSIDLDWQSKHAVASIFERLAKEGLAIVYTGSKS